MSSMLTGRTQFSDVLMGEAAVNYELRPILAGPLVIRRVEDVLFQLRVQIKLSKDLLRNQMLGAKIPGTLISAIVSHFLLT